MNKVTIDYIKQWLSKANEDLLVVSKLTEFEIIATSSACFHCQQAVEKFLKAFLIANGVETKKTHNIEFLLSECSDIDKDFADIDPKEFQLFLESVGHLLILLRILPVVMKKACQVQSSVCNT